MLIIIEGVDRVGKTTLANKLAKILPKAINYKMIDEINILKDHNAVIDTAKQIAVLQAYKACGLCNFIIDRFHLSTALYEITLSKNIRAKAQQMKLDSIIADMDTILVYVKPEDIELSSKLHGDELNEDVKIMNSLVLESKIKRKIPITWSSIENDELGTIINAIKDIVNEKVIKRRTLGL